MTLQKILKSFLWVFRYLFFTLISRISLVIPKKKDLWLFGSWNGMRFGSSTKYLFLYVINNCTDIQAVWITKNKIVFEHLKNKSLPVTYAWSLKGILLCFRAEVIFITHLIYDINPCISDGSIIVQLFHHVLPLKFMSPYRDYKNDSTLKKIRNMLKNPHTLRKPDYYISSSKWLTNNITIPKLWADSEKVLETGFPRSDAILNNSEYENDNNYLKELISYNGNSIPTIVYYLPTHRDHSSNFNPFQYEFDINLLNKLLKQSNAYFIYKFHPRDYERLSNRLNPKYNRIILEKNGFQDPYVVLRNAKVLIVDYGSTFSDFLLLSRPIIFAHFDLDEYCRIRKLNWDYNKFTPGYKANNWNLVIQSLKEILIEKKDRFKKDRDLLRDHIYQFKDTKNSKRVVEMIKSISANN